MSVLHSSFLSLHGAIELFNTCFSPVSLAFAKISSTLFSSFFLISSSNAFLASFSLVSSALIASATSSVM